MNIKDKHVVLTGACGGIGREIAQQMAGQGAILHLIGRNIDSLNKLAASLQLEGGRVHLIEADIASAEGLALIVAHCEKIAAGIQLLINCAGVNEFGFFSAIDEDQIAKIIQVNITAPMLLVRKLIPLLSKNKEAMILNVGSTFGSIGYPGFVVYSASKFALRGFSEALRRELADTMLDVRYIAPRATKTAINSDTINAMNKELGVAMDDPKAVAKEVIRVIANKAQANTYLGWPEKLFVRINAILPRLVDNALLKQLPIIKRYAQLAKS